MRRRRSIAWLALLATLFSAASPALAALLAHTPAVSARMLGLGEPPEHAHHGHHADDGGTPAHAPADGSTHQSHGVFCSFCLNPSSLSTLAAAPAAVPVLSLAFDLAAPLTASQHVALFIPQYRSRAPPRSS